MAKYDAVTLDATWEATLEVLNQSWPGNVVQPSVGVNAIGGGAVATYYGIEAYGPARYHDDSQPPPATQWRGRYILFTVSVSAPGPTTDAVYVALWIDDHAYPPPAFGPNPLPTPNTVVEGSGFTVDFTMTLSGLYMMGAATDDPPDDRGFLWFGDRTFTSSWYIDGSASVTVAASVNGVDLSASGDPSFGMGEVSLGTNVRALVGLGVAGFASAGTVYARISGFQWDEEPVNLEKLDLYNPGDSSGVPDGTVAPGWSRIQSTSNCARVTDTSGMALWAAGTYTSAATFNAHVYAPVVLNFIPRDGKFADDEAYAVTYYGPPILWAEGAVPPGALSAGLTETVGSTTWYAYRYTWSDDAGLHVSHQRVTWEFAYEWQRLSTTNVWVKALQSWRETSDEHVDEAGDEEAQQDDVDVPLILHPRNASDLVGVPDWGPFLTISREGELGVCKPSGVSRPADWVGSGGLTPSGSGAANDTWNVAAGSSAPAATFTLPSLYWVRMNRLSDHQETEEFHFTWFPVFFRPNVQQVGGQYLDPVSERVPEAEWCWRYYSHLEVRFATAPRAATVTVTVHYSYPSWVEDPCVTCFEYRYGPEGTFDFGMATGTATYQTTVAAGSNVTADPIDLLVPLSGTALPRLAVVDSVTLTFDAAAGDETWVLADLYLCLAKWAAIPAHCEARMYDPYDWLHDYTMFQALVDGVPVFDLRYGYDGLEGTERALKGRQKWRHCPTSSLPGIMDYAKLVSVLAFEVWAQRGFTATDEEAEDAAVNKDGTGGRVLSALRWFDLKECHEDKFDTTQEVHGQPRVITWQVVAGVETDIYHVKFPQGRLHGLLYDEENRANGRYRSEGSVYLWQKLPGGAAAVIEGPVTPDGFGRYRMAPVKEHDFSEDLDWLYGVSTDSETEPTAWGEVDNRRYLWTIGLLEEVLTGHRYHAALAPWGSVVGVHPSEVVWPNEEAATTPVTWVDNWLHWVNAAVYPELRETLTHAKNPTVAISPNGNLCVVLESTDTPVLYSYRTGPTGKGGSQVATIPGYVCPTVTRREDTGDLLMLAIDDATNRATVLRGTDGGSSWAVVGDLGAADRCPGGIVVTPQGRVFAFKVLDATIYPYESVDDCRTWEAK